MTPLVLAGLLALAGAPGTAIELEERQPVIMLALTPNGAVSSTSMSELYRVADAALRAKTRLFIRTPEQAGVDLAQIGACELSVRLSCWVESVRASGAAYLLVVSIHPLSGADRLTSLLINMADAVRELDRGGGGLEDRIFERTVNARPVVSKSSQQYFEALFGEELAPAFEASHHTEPFGAIALEGSAPGLTLELDGKPIGATSGETTELRGLTPRTRKLAISDPRGHYAALALEVAVEPGKTARVPLALVPISSERAAGITAKKAVVWSGLATAGLGAVLTTYALAAGPSARDVSLCPEGQCSNGTVSTFASFCELGASDPASCGKSGRVLAAPLGYSVMLGGGIIALGSALFAGDDEIPWLPIAAGVLAGGFAYALSAALD